MTCRSTSAWLDSRFVDVSTDNLFETTPKAVEELTAAAKAFIDNVKALHATIDGVEAPDLFSHREQSSVFTSDPTGVSVSFFQVFGR